MPLSRTHRTTAAPRRSLFNRRSPRAHGTTTHVTTTTTTRRRRGGLFSSNKRAARPARAPVAAVHHQKRKPTLKDKVSGAMLKLKGSLTRRPAVKAAGTRRMHGTDGRGSRRRRY